ncbi:MAG: hypothetical protein ACXWDN_19645 [Limisphaerales bacterium]
MAPMLRELSNTRQIDGELSRKWYFCHELDLVVWFNSEGAPCAFQLAYDKYDNEHSISWHYERGYRHYVVDDGERTSECFGTPFLYAAGLFRKDTVLEKFSALSGELPPAIAQMVEEKLRDFDEPRP